MLYLNMGFGSSCDSGSLGCACGICPLQFLPSCMVRPSDWPTQRKVPQLLHMLKRTRRQLQNGRRKTKLYKGEGAKAVTGLQIAAGSEGVKFEQDSNDLTIVQVGSNASGLESRQLRISRSIENASWKERHVFDPPSTWLGSRIHDTSTTELAAAWSSVGKPPILP